MGCGATEKDFSFWMPLEITKGNKEGEMRIGGVASDENAEDLQGERVFVDGLDISYLLERGAFNWNHEKGADAILGEIDKADKGNGKLYVEGFLYQNKSALKVFDLMEGMKKSGSKRKLGLSVEGKIKERDLETGKDVKKAWIKNVAITYNPINKGTWIDLIKSLGGFTFSPCQGDCAKCSFCECTEEKAIEDSLPDQRLGPDPREDPVIHVNQPELDPREPQPLSGTTCPKCGKVIGLLPIDDPNACICDLPVSIVIPMTGPEVEKALSAGYDCPATSGGVSGSALREESLEKKPKVTTYEEEDIKKKKKGFTKSEFVEWLKAKKYNGDTQKAELLADCIFKAVEYVLPPTPGGIRDLYARAKAAGRTREPGAEGKVKGHPRTRRGKYEWVKPHSRLKGSDLAFRNTLEGAVKKWIEAKDVGEVRPFPQWLKETNAPTYDKLIVGIKI